MAGMTTEDWARRSLDKMRQDEARRYAQSMAGTQQTARQQAAQTAQQLPAAGQSQAAGQDYSLAQTPGQAQQAAPSQAVADAQNYLAGQVNGQQSGAGPYGSDVESLYHAIMDRPKFSYDVNQDPLFQQYKNQYMVNGQRAMQDVMGQSAALTGGYGNSWGNTAGFKAYQYYLQQLNDRIPELEAQAYDRYQAEGDELRDNYNLALQFEQYQSALRNAGSGGATRSDTQRTLTGQTPYNPALLELLRTKYNGTLASDATLKELGMTREQYDQLRTAGTGSAFQAAANALMPAGTKTAQDRLMNNALNYAKQDGLLKTLPEDQLTDEQKAARARNVQNNTQRAAQRAAELKKKQDEEDLRTIIGGR